MSWTIVTNGARKKPVVTLAEKNLCRTSGISLEDRLQKTIPYFVGLEK